jgi:hypothetical protein
MSALMTEPLIAAPEQEQIEPQAAATTINLFAMVGGGPGSEKRKEPRYATCDPADISLLDMASLQVPGVVRDVSRNGIRIEVVLPVSMGARLKICLPKRAIIFAVARYCRRTKDTYQVGAEIESVYYPKQASTISPQLEGPDALPESGLLARSIVQEHTAFPIGARDQSQSRRSEI